MINSKLLRLSVVLSLALSWQNALAEESKTLPKVTVTAEEEQQENGYKTESSSSSTRTDTPLLDTPQSVAIVTQDQITDQNITSLEQASRYVPGVNVQLGEGHRDQVTIRGMNNGSNGTTSNFFVDGARDDAEYIRDFYNTEKIEFLKGPNAMAFGRGSPGGVINRVTKKADGKRRRRLQITGGSFNNRRIQADIGDKVNDKVAVRLNTMYQKSHSYRDHAQFERYGVNPTVTFKLNDKSKLEVGYEHFDDLRFNDRGIPSVNGGAYQTNPSSFFGNPNANRSQAKINSYYGNFEHKFSDSLKLKNTTRYTITNKFYRNILPNGVDGDTLNLSGYSNEMNRDTVTNQTDITKKFNTGSLKHTALFGSEITRQSTLLNRFNDSGDITVPLSKPITYETIAYDSPGTNGRSDVDILAAYVQDQIDVNKYLQLTAGLRVDRFRMKFNNQFNSTTSKRVDTLFSPRAGLVVKPQEELSLYASYGVTNNPSSGDQFNSLSEQTAGFKPERTQSYELGAKWDINPKLNISTAIFQIDRTNTRANDANDNVVLTGEARVQGFELATSGAITDKWQITGGYTFQDARITSATQNASRGNRVALVPHNTFSLWNKYNLTDQFATAFGIISQSDQYADAANSTRLEGFTRYDAALFYKINKSYKIQLNVENIFDTGYILTAHNSKNLLPGSTRAYNLTLIADF